MVLYMSADIVTSASRHNGVTYAGSVFLHSDMPTVLVQGTQVCYAVVIVMAPAILEC